MITDQPTHCSARVNIEMEVANQLQHPHIIGTQAYAKREQPLKTDVCPLSAALTLQLPEIHGLFSYLPVQLGPDLQQRAVLLEHAWTASMGCSFR